VSSNTPTSQIQQAPYLRVQRQFPDDDLKDLSSQMDQTYIDIAIKVNKRIIGTFAVNFQIITGESWFLTGQPNRQQTLRQVYPITAAGKYPIGFSVASINGFTRIYGTFTDGTFWYPLPWVSVVSATNQISMYIQPAAGGNPDFLIVQSGAGAPPIVSGWIVLEWLSNV
jgi:hypothetical protein